MTDLNLKLFSDTKLDGWPRSQNVMTKNEATLLLRITKLELERLEVKQALDMAGTATGHETYSLAKRIANLATERDYFIRQTDIARAEINRLENDPITKEAMSLYRATLP